MSQKWTSADVPDQSGRIAVVTGANSGLGYDTAAVLADKGAHVVLAVRNLEKGAQAADRIKAASPNAVVTLAQLDLSSLDSVRSAGREPARLALLQEMGGRQGSGLLVGLGQADPGERGQTMSVNVDTGREAQEAEDANGLVR